MKAGDKCERREAVSRTTKASKSEVSSRLTIELDGDEITSVVVVVVDYCMRFPRLCSPGEYNMY